MKVSFKQFRSKTCIDEYTKRLSDLKLASSDEALRLHYLLSLFLANDNTSPEHKHEAEELLIKIIGIAHQAKINYIRSFQLPRPPTEEMVQITEHIQMLEQEKARALAAKERLAKFKLILLSTVPELLFAALTASAFLLYIAFILVMPVGGAQVITSIAFITAACLLIPIIAGAIYNFIKTHFQALMETKQTEANQIEAQIQANNTLLIAAQERNSINNKVIENYDFVILHANADINEIDYELVECGFRVEPRSRYGTSASRFFKNEATVQTVQEQEQTQFTLNR